MNKFKSKIIIGLHLVLHIMFSVLLLHPLLWYMFLFLLHFSNVYCFTVSLTYGFVVQVGVKSKTAEVQSKSENVILVDTNKNQVHILGDVLLEGLKMFDILHLSDVYCGIYFSNFLFFPLIRSNHCQYHISPNTKSYMQP